MPSIFFNIVYFGPFLHNQRHHVAHQNNFLLNPIRFFISNIDLVTTHSENMLFAIGLCQVLIHLVPSYLTYIDCTSRATLLSGCWYNLDNILLLTIKLLLLLNIAQEISNITLHIDFWHFIFSRCPSFASLFRFIITYKLKCSINSSVKFISLYSIRQNTWENASECK